MVKWQGRKVTNHKFKVGQSAAFKSSTERPDWVQTEASERLTFEPKSDFGLEKVSSSHEHAPVTRDSVQYDSSLHVY